jgi:hypothetical protein
MKKQLRCSKLIILIAFILSRVDTVQAQQWDWATSTTRLNFATVYIAQLAADAQGNSYVTGTFQDVVNFGPHQLTASQLSSGYQANPDLFVAKLTASGQWAWAVQAGGTSGQTKGIGLAVDASGQNVYVTVAFSQALTNDAASRGALRVFSNQRGTATATLIWW